ncbi:MAG: hypothetical protein RSA17_02790 [Ruthenibacterium sp.]
MWFKNTEKPYPAEWMVLCGFILLIAVSYTYNDMVATTRHGIMLWDALFQGKILDFYDITYAVQPGNSIFVTGQMASYEFTVYVLFGLWDFPLWAVEKLFHISATENIFCLIWSKMELLLFVALAAAVLRRIAQQLKMSRGTQQWLVFAWLSSVLLGSSTLLMSQYDIFSLFFMLCGFLAFLRKEPVKFVLFFSVAISCKYFALLVFIPLLLLRCKKVLSIVINGCLAFSVSLFWKAIFLLGRVGAGGASADRVGTGGLGAANTLLPTFFTWLTDTGLYPASVFLISMLAICIWCYAQQEETAPDERKAIFAAAAATLAFAVESPLHPYWIVIVTPFVMLLVFSNANRFKLNLLLEMTFSVSVLVQQWVRFDWCFANRVVMPMVFGKLLGLAPDEWTGIAHWVTILNDSGVPVLQIAASLMLCCAGALLIFNVPAKQTLASGADIKVERSVMRVRFAAFAGTALLSIVYYCRYMLLR